MYEKQTETNHLPQDLHEGSTLETSPASLQENKKSAEKIKTSQIQTLNDVLRTTFTTGAVMFTHGIQNLDEQVIEAILKKVQQFDDFSKDNDPYGEHDFGIVQAAGETAYWKIDYYDKDMNGGSEDPSDSEVTSRVLTIMLRSEY